MEEIAFVIPCFNEQVSIGLVITELRDLFPDASIYVCDNHSLDRTAEVARAAGAVGSSVLWCGRWGCLLLFSRAGTGGGWELYLAGKLSNGCC